MSILVIGPVVFCDSVKLTFVYKETMYSVIEAVERDDVDAIRNFLHSMKDIFLDIAIEKNSIKVAKYLIESGVRSPRDLRKAAFFNHLEIVKMLLAKRSNKEQLNNEEKEDILNLCRSAKIQDILSLNADLELDEMFISALTDANINIIKYCILQGLEINENYFYKACYYGYLNVVKLLLHYGNISIDRYKAKYSHVYHFSLIDNFIKQDQSIIKEESRKEVYMMNLNRYLKTL